MLFSFIPATIKIFLGTNSAHFIRKYIAKDIRMQLEWSSKARLQSYPLF